MLGPIQPHIVSLSHFVDVVVGAPKVGLSSAVSSVVIPADGDFFFEFTQLLPGMCQIGFGLWPRPFSDTQGCGDFMGTYAVDGSRHRRWNQVAHEYAPGRLLGVVGDVFGCAIHRSAGAEDISFIEFFRNGMPLGVAFRDISSGPLRPMVSLAPLCGGLVNFGAVPFRYPITGYVGCEAYSVDAAPVVRHVLTGAGPAPALVPHQIFAAVVGLATAATLTATGPDTEPAVTEAVASDASTEEEPAAAAAVYTDAELRALSSWSLADRRAITARAAVCLPAVAQIREPAPLLFHALIGAAAASGIPRSVLEYNMLSRNVPRADIRAAGEILGNSNVLNLVGQLPESIQAFTKPLRSAIEQAAVDAAVVIVIAMRSAPRAALAAFHRFAHGVLGDRRNFPWAFKMTVTLTSAAALVLAEAAGLRRGPLSALTDDAADADGDTEATHQQPSLANPAKIAVLRTPSCLPGLENFSVTDTLAGQPSAAIRYGGDIAQKIVQELSFPARRGASCVAELSEALQKAPLPIVEDFRARLAELAPAFPDLAEPPVRAFTAALCGLHDFFLASIRSVGIWDKIYRAQFERSERIFSAAAADAAVGEMAEYQLAGTLGDWAAASPALHELIRSVHGYYLREAVRALPLGPRGRPLLAGGTEMSIARHPDPESLHPAWARLVWSPYVHVQAAISSSTPAVLADGPVPFARPGGPCDTAVPLFLSRVLMAGVLPPFAQVDICKAVQVIGSGIWFAAGKAAPTAADIQAVIHDENAHAAFTRTLAVACLTVLAQPLSGSNSGMARFHAESFCAIASRLMLVLALPPGAPVARFAKNPTLSERASRLTDTDGPLTPVLPPDAPEPLADVAAVVAMRRRIVGWADDLGWWTRVIINVSGTLGRLVDALASTNPSREAGETLQWAATLSEFMLAWVTLCVSLNVPAAAAAAGSTSTPDLSPTSSAETDADVRDEPRPRVAARALANLVAEAVRRIYYKYAFRTKDGRSYDARVPVVIPLLMALIMYVGPAEARRLLRGSGTPAAAFELLSFARTPFSERAGEVRGSTTGSQSLFAARKRFLAPIDHIDHSLPTSEWTKALSEAPGVLAAQSLLAAAAADAEADAAAEAVAELPAEENEEGLCPICYAQPATGHLEPCGHSACADCLDRLGVSGLENCFFCHQPVTQVVLGDDDAAEPAVPRSEPVAAAEPAVGELDSEEVISDSIDEQ